MLSADRILRASLAHGLRLWSGVPCSYLTPLIDRVIEGVPGMAYVGAANEGDAVAIAAGAWLGGYGGVAMMQNSGLGNAVSPLTSLTHTFRIPILLIVTHRGQPGGPPDEPQHALMGTITTAMLELMGIPWAPFPHEEDVMDATLRQAVEHMDRTSTPFALVMSKGAVAPSLTTSRGDRPQRSFSPTSSVTAHPIDAPRACAPAAERPSRTDVLRAVQAAASLDDVVIATTGYTGRELYALDDRPTQLYMAGSMGCASTLGLGLALSRPDRRVIVLDGDGALLMRMGALATIGHERPSNLVHVVLDNGMHESTGGQSTVSDTVDFAAVALGCGYPRALRLSDAAAVEKALAASPGLQMLHIPICGGTLEGLPRPRISPPEVARRLRAHLGPSSHP